MQRRMLLVIMACASISGVQSRSALAQDDVANCRTIAASRVTGLHIAYRGRPPVPVNDQNGPVPYDSDARLYYVPAVNGRAVHVPLESAWHVRTQTIARTAKANAALVWRPQVATRCSANQMFDAFDRNERYISLQRYYDYHPPAGRRRGTDPGLQRYFHFEVQDYENGNCVRTDQTRVAGDLHDAYGFEDVERDPTVVAQATTITRAIARTSLIFSGLSSELAYVAGPTDACFGFNVPLPTRLTFSMQFTPWTRDDDIQGQARGWRPERTTITIHRVPKRGPHRTIVVHWKN